MDLYRIAFRIIAGKAKRLAILFQPDKEVIILHTETEDWAVTTVKLPDGTRMQGKYQITDGEVSEFPTHIKNDTKYSNYEAVKLLGKAWEYGFEKEGYNFSGIGDAVTQCPLSEFESWM